MFYFKEFSIDDSGATMKVGNDATLLGSLVETLFEPTRILNVGTGCGILALMMAQKYRNAIIDAIDIDKQTVETAASNFKRSVWHDRLHSIETSFQQCSTTEKNLYDLIVSNPPYFTNSLKNESPRKTIARHDDTLPLAELFENARRLLHAEGTLVIIMPTSGKESVLTTAEACGLHCISETDIGNYPYDSPIRTVFHFTPKEGIQKKTTSRFQRNDDNSYSDWYRAITLPYLLWEK